MNDETRREEILGRTLAALRVRRKRRRRALGSVSMLAVVAAAGVLLGWLTGGGDESRPVAAWTGGHLRVAIESPSPVPGHDEVARWSSPSALVLVVNAEGMEMRALNDSQVRALARKPGCEFALTPDAVMWVSEVADEAVHFDVLTDF